MGNISSRQDDNGMLYVKDQTRFSIKSVVISNGRKKVVLNLSTIGASTPRVLPRRPHGDDTPIAYIQDPETGSSGLLLRLDLEDELNFQFTLSARQTAPTQTAPGSNLPTGNLDTNIPGLTFAFAPNSKELDTLITREFHSDPNLHRNSNVHLIGDIATQGSPTVDYEWSWKWTPPKTGEDRGGGWRNNCSFLEYDSRAHRLNTLTSFAFWVQNTRPAVPPGPAAPHTELNIPSIRRRMPSSQSYYSAVSDSEGPTDSVVSPSPSMPPNDWTTIASSSGPPVPSVDVGRPAEDMSNVEDGPVFRATMKSLEQKTGNMRAHMKKVLKKAESAQQAQAECNETMKAFLSALQEASDTNASAFKPALEHYFSKVAGLILQYEEDNSKLLRKEIIDPLSRVYTYDIKQAESKKKDFEDESRDYYAYVSRYLGQRQDSLKEKKRAESDSKYQSKKRNFELKRFDYSNFMQDLHGGRKEQELLSQLTKYADRQTKSFLSTARRVEVMQPQLDALVREVAEADKEYKIQRTEREEKRRNLEMNHVPGSLSELETTPVAVQPVASNQTNSSTGYASDTDLSRADSTSSQFALSTRSALSPSNSVSYQAANAGAISTSPSSAMTSNINKFRGIRDLEERDPSASVVERQVSGQNRKEGLLWALSKPGSHIDPKGINKQAWHKFWIVLDQGKLSEYANWKDRMELHRDPIDLRMASVRMARDAERRFCFEVITPHYKRIYQATNDDEMNSWISSINNALQSAFESRSAQVSTPTPRADRAPSEYGAVLTGKSASQSGPHGVSGRSESVGVNRRVTVGSRPSYVQTASGSYDDNPTKLLNQVRANDQGNQDCADCGSNTRVEWVSLNLGIILCIECGGIHRSLGTHVSKIRSLTLDIHSFTDDIVELLLLIGNRVSNMVWEAKLDRRLKPEPWANRETRLKFITAKYVERAFVEPVSNVAHPHTVDENLLVSIKRNDIQGVLLGIAQRANVNVHDRSRNTHAIFLALAAADPARPLSPSTSPAGNRKTADATVMKAFPVAELLVQNGAEFPLDLPAIPLSPAAQVYVEQRTARGAAAAAAADTLGPLLTVTKGSDSAAKLQKRGSTGAKFAGKVSSLTER